MNKKSLTCFGAIALLVSVAQAQVITYVDAVSGGSGNTFATGGSLADTSWLVNNNNSNLVNDAWDTRTFGTGATILQGNPNQAAAGTVPELTTQLTGLADGVYDIWVFYADNGAGGNPAPTSGQAWNIAAGFTSGALTNYNEAAGTETTALTFSGSAPVAEPASEITLLGVNIGQANVVGGSTIDIFVNNAPTGVNFDRTWYDGVGYSVVPEPSTFALLLIAGTGILALRRRK
ncbi:MAG: PEP-CTERM sorting domain-containing protein [Verrucomicrobiota bacterium]